MLRLSILMASLALGACGCNASGGDPSSESQPAATASAELHLFADHAVGCRFTIPNAGLRVAAEHFDPSTPSHKMKHSVAVSSLAGTVVRIDVWDNTDKLSLQQWFDKHLAFSVTQGAIAETRLVGRARQTAIVVDQKRSPQSQARRIVTLAQDDRVFRITCLDSEDPTSLDILRDVLDSFEMEGHR